MQDIRFSYKNAVAQDVVNGYKDAVMRCQEMLDKGTGKGSDFLGWLTLPQDIREQISDIQATADLLRSRCDVIVCIGIGGSYLGAKAVIDALQSSFAWLENRKPYIVYAGQNIGEDYLFELQNLLKDKRFGIICISKSGTTTEPALAFSLLKTQLEAHCAHWQTKKATRPSSSRTTSADVSPSSAPSDCCLSPAQDSTSTP